MIQLGQQARDKVTGFEGIVTARVEYLTGCNQYGLTPPAREGKVEGTEYFDEARIDIVGRGILPEAVQGEAKGGPNRDAPRR